MIFFKVQWEKSTSGLSLFLSSPDPSSPSSSVLSFVCLLYWLCSWRLLRQEGPVAEGGILHVLGSGVNLGESGLGRRGSEPKKRGTNSVATNGISYIS